MGAGSRNFAVYYCATAIMYLVIMSICFSLIASVAPDCQVKCPTLIAGPPNNGQPNYKACLCQVTDPRTNTSVIAQANGFIATWPNETQQQRWEVIKQATIDVGRSCYICPSNSDASIYEACSVFTQCNQGGMLGFRPAQNLSICNTQPNQTAYAGILVSPTVTNRAIVLGVLYCIASFYLIQMLCAFVCFVGYQMFANKYGSDWTKLNKTEDFFGYMCKVAPIVTRLCNFVVLFFIIAVCVTVFEYSVCRYDTNSFGDIVFWPTITGFTVFVGISWLAVCVVGTTFQSLVPRE